MLIAALAVILGSCAHRGSGVKVPKRSRVFATLAGAWVGELEYADFSDDSRSRIPVRLEVLPSKSGDRVIISLAFREPSGETLLSQERHELDPSAREYRIDGRGFAIDRITGFAGEPAGELVWTGEEMENGTVVRFRQTIRLRGRSLEILKETRSPLRFRNQIRAERE